MKKNLLELSFNSRDLGKTLTVKAFFIELLITLWKEKEGFSGKRPFGNSDWDSDLVACMIKNKAFPGEIDEDGNPEEYDQKAFNKFVLKKIIEKL